MKSELKHRGYFSLLCPSPFLIDVNVSDATSSECIPEGSENCEKIRSFDACQACLTKSESVFYLQVFHYALHIYTEGFMWGLQMAYKYIGRDVHQIKASFLIFVLPYKRF